jgi:hypothetical protein
MHSCTDTHTRINMCLFILVQRNLESNFYLYIFWKKTLVETLVEVSQDSKEKGNKTGRCKKRRKRVETEKDIEEYLALFLSAKSLNGFTPE